jgi:GntR family transcriptional regulator
MSPFPDPELILEGGAAIHRQIEHQLRRFIQTGTLTPGEELPTVRAVAVEMAINPGAVEEAYGNLEREGYLTRKEGTGVLVAPRASWDALTGPRRTKLESLCAEFLKQAWCDGCSTNEVLHVLHAQLEKRTS